MKMPRFVVEAHSAERGNALIVDTRYLQSYHSTEKRATLLWGGMSETFVKLIRSEEMRYLARKHRNAFILLTFIAERARRENGYPDGLVIGESHIGDHKEYGLTEKEYRTAKKILVERKHIEIIETCRSRKNSRAAKKTSNSENVKKETTERATKVTTIGTLVKIISTTIYDINPEDPNQQKGDRKGDRGATEGRPKGDEQEGRRKDISNDISNEEEALRAGTHPASPIRAKDLLIFNFEKWEFEGITEQDLADWKLMYPHIDIKVETLKASQWLKNNPSKSNKKQWRKYLTGWYGRSNDSIENKKAYRSATGTATQDRRTKNKDGTPISSRAEDLF